MTVISASDLTLSFGVDTIFEDISFSLNENDKMGIIGVNGSGKTSLFRVILGEYTPDRGEVFIANGTSVGVLTQTGAFDADENDTPISVMYAAFPELTAAEERLAFLQGELARNDYSEGLHMRLFNEFNQLNQKFIADGGLEFRGRCASILKRMGYTDEMLTMPIKNLSGGQKTRLALSRQLCREPDILLLDEPTNHLDVETLTWLESFLASYKKCIMVISHDRYFLDRVTNKTLIIEHKRARLYNGGYTAACKKRDEDDKTREKHYKEQQKEIARQEAYIAQQRQFNRERNIIAAESRLKLLAKMEKIERPKEAPKPIKMKFQKQFASGNDVLEAKGLAVGYNGIPLARGLDFLIKRGERVFIAGPNGCGKSTLIKTFIGDIEPVSGAVAVGYNVEVGYYDQENQNLTESNTFLDELWNAYPRKPEVEIRNTLASFRFIGEEVFKKVSMLSGGERARLTLAKLILSEMNLLILDEPTNHLDIDSKESLEAALADFDGTIIAVSHDRYFIDKLATRIIAMKPGEAFGKDFMDHTTTRHGEGYTEFAEYKARRELELTDSAPKTVNTAVPSASKEDYLRAKKELADTRREQKRMERLKKEAETLEADLERISEELFGEAATDYVRAAELQKEQAEKEERLMEIYEEIGV